LNTLMGKRLTVSVIVLDDTKPPGGRPDYADAQVLPFEHFTYITGGSIYQVSSASTLSALWIPQLFSTFSSYSVTHAFHRKCSDKVEYFQVGTDDTNLVLDVFSPLTADLRIWDPTGEEVTIDPNSPRTLTNQLIPLQATKPGVWRVHHNAGDEQLCSVGVRAVRTVRPHLAFHTDVGLDRGFHSQNAQLAPIGGVGRNAIVAAADDAELQLVSVQVYTVEEYGNKLVFASRLIKRTDDCRWNYVSAELFTCPARWFTVAVSAIDGSGHALQRIFKMYCMRYRDTE